MLDDPLIFNTLLQYITDLKISYGVSIIATSFEPTGSKGGLGLVYMFSFIVICLLGTISVVESLREAIVPKRKTLSKIFLYIGSTVLAYELFLFFIVFYNTLS